MTLPNRVGYSVEEKKPPTTVPTEQFHLPPFPTPPEPHFSSLFPFLGNQTDVMKIVDRNLTFPPVPDFPPMEPPPRMTELFKPQPLTIDSLSSEELQARKNYIRSHRLLNLIMEFLVAAKKEGISPSAEIFSYIQNAPQPGTMDFSLDEFLSSQGIEGPDLEDEEPEKSVDHSEFLFKLEQLKEKYNEELEKLSQVCNEFCSRLFNLLREQSTLRPLSDQETQMKMQAIQHKFDYVKAHLRQNVCNAIVALEKQYNYTKKKRKALPKKASEALNQWFYEHLHDPYPTEEEKSILAAAGGLTITQVNNWFGNKRIRYKRKCLEEEAKRAGMERLEPAESIPNSRRRIKTDE